MYEAKLGTEKTTDITKINAKPAYKPKPKPVREPEPRVEEKIIIKKKKKEYLDNYQYAETKDIKNKNPRFQVIVEHQRLGEVFGGTFEETSYQRQVFAQGSNRPRLNEKTTTVTRTGSSKSPVLRGNKSAVTTTKKTTTTTTTRKGPVPKTASSRTINTTTTRNTRIPTSGTARQEKVTQTLMKSRINGITHKY